MGSFKAVCSIILICLSLIILVSCAIWAFIFSITHVDMTDMRQLIENLGPLIGAVLGLIMFGVGEYLAKRS